MDEVILSILLFLAVFGIIVLVFILRELCSLGLNMIEIRRISILSYLNTQMMYMIELLRQKASCIACEEYEQAQKIEELMKKAELEINEIIKKNSTWK